MELEATGDIALAALTAGCTVVEVHRWRRSDPKFARDFTLAIAAHLRMLRGMVSEVARESESELLRDRAADLLASEDAYRDPDGRLDAKAWATLLRKFLADLGMDVASWEPRIE